VIQVALDGLLWNLVFFIINAARIAEMLYERRHVDFRPELEFIYANLFSPGSPSTLDRLEFLELERIANVVVLQPGETYVEAGAYCDRVGIIVDGAVSVSFDNDIDVMRELRKLEFLDSQEFVFQHHKYMVTMKATKATTLVVWEKAALATLHVAVPNIKSAFFSAIAYDMSRNFSEVQKLFIHRSHKTTKYIRKLHKTLEDAKIQTNIEGNIKKYELSPMVSSRYVHQGSHDFHPQKILSKKGLTKGKGKVPKHPPGDITVSLVGPSSETSDSDQDTIGRTGGLNVRNPSSPTTSGTLPDLRF